MKKSTLITVSGFVALSAAVSFGAMSQEHVGDCCSGKSSAPVASYPTSGGYFAPSAARGSATLLGKVRFEGELALAAGGVAKFEGDKPDAKPLEIAADKSEGCGTVPTEDRGIVIAEDGGVANVIITVDVKGAEVKAPEEAIALDQSSCRFEPHVVVVPMGAKVAFNNSDETGHNVHTYPKKNNAMNKTIPAGGSEEQVFEFADQVEIKCDIHPWMNSWLIVTDTPYFAVTGADGSFSLEGLPAGTHKVNYWHEKLGKGKSEIVVAEDGSSEPLEISLSASKKGGKRRRR